MRTSPAGVLAIEQFEGCVLHTYRCPAGVCTIGCGHTGPEVVPGLTWTRAQAQDALQKDLARFERAVDEAVTQPLTQGQFDAMVSLAFNIGADAFARSSLVKAFNAGNVKGAGQQFVVWHKVAGAPSAALLQRRASELWTFARATPTP